MAQSHSANPAPTSKPACYITTQTTSLTEPIKLENTQVPLPESPPQPHDEGLTPSSTLPHPVSGVSLPLSNEHTNAVINLLESELPPPTWAIFQPFSGIIIGSKDVNISSCSLGRGPEGSTLVNSLWEAAR